MLERAALFALGVLGLLSACELACRVLPVSTATYTDYYLDPLFVTYPAHHEWRVASGWDLRNAQVLHSNNLGFADDVDALPNPDAVALIGDSYIESSALPASQRPAARLRAALDPRRPVYAMGTPGTALLDYAERVRWASNALGVRDFVLFLEVGDLRQSLCGSGNIDGPCIEPDTLRPAVELHPKPSLAKRILRHSALAQYLTGQARIDLPAMARQLWPGRPVGARVAPTGHAEAPHPSAAIDTVCATFLARIEPFRKGRFVLVFDARHDATAFPDPQLAFERQRFMREAAERGLQVVDMAPVYREHFRHSTLSLDVAPSNGHLNAIGVDLLADAVAPALQAPVARRR